MLGLKIGVLNQTFRRRPFVPLQKFCHPARGYNFPIRTIPKKSSVSELWVIFWGSPRTLAISGLSQFVSISTLNIGPWSTKLCGTVGVIKKWPRMTTDLVRAGITEKRPVLRLAKKWFLAQITFFFLQKNTRHLLKE